MTKLRFLRSRTLWVAIIIAFFLMIAFIMGNNIKSSTVTATSTYLTTQVRRGDIEALVTVSGRLMALNEADLSFQVSGVISTVVVKEGDLVKQGQPLARLDSRDAELNYAATQASLKQAKAKLESVKNGSAKELANAQANLKQAQTKLQLARTGNVMSEDVRVAQADLDQAQSFYNSLLNKPNQKDIQSAEAGLRQAKAKLEQVQGGSNTQAIQQAEAAVEIAKQNLSKVISSTNANKEQARISQEQAQRNFETAKANYDKIYSQNHMSDGTIKLGLAQSDLDAEKTAKNAQADAQNNLDKAKLAYADAQTQAEAGQKEAQSKVVEAQANLDKIKADGQTQQKEIAVAQADVDKAQADLDKAHQGATKDELDAALAATNSARAKLEKLNKSNASEKEVALAQSEVDKAQAAVDSLNRGANAADLNNATALVEEADALNKRAQLRLEQAILQAPFNGVVGLVRMVSGQNTNANSTVLTLLDLSGLKMETVVPEADIAQVKVGQVARLSLEVIPNIQDLRGHITAIASRANAVGSNGAIGYPVTIVLDKPLSPESDLLTHGAKPGMTSNVRLVVEGKADVLVVPSQAVKPLGETKVVEVLTEGGQIVTVPVTLGVKGIKEVEVLEPSLLIPGDQLLLNSRSDAQLK
ncbi:MAG: HlyD family efflux transporter periplasmic adaptor subunit [Chloroflexota bacterium]|nr:HlyD family efflux transporter periplasmic adaptor subunit [Chloroflexota bacterium]